MFRRLCRAGAASMRSLTSTLHDPVVTDRSVDLMAAVLWACYAGWGIVSVVTGLPTIASATTPVYEVFWGGSIGALGAVASAAAISTLVNTTSVDLRIRKKVIELTSVSILAGFVSVYPVFIIAAAFGGDPARAATIPVALSYLVVPTWRVRLLFLRIRALRATLGPTS
jgi:hypothetical protein